ncbi:MAG: hypothetical protein J7498_02940 [Sphingobium sp.]|nr:hypothetical protein [Sphingobium sp.]
MIAVRVESNGFVPYNRAAVHSLWGCKHVWRLEEFGTGLTSEGPHFNFQLPDTIRGGGTLGALKGNPRRYFAEAPGLLGQVDFCSGAPARDGTESYEIAKLEARWETEGPTVIVTVDIELGAGIADTNAVINRHGEQYRIVLHVPPCDLPDYLEIERYSLSDAHKIEWQDNLSALLMKRFQVDLTHGSAERSGAAHG